MRIFVVHSVLCAALMVLSQADPARAQQKPGSQESLFGDRESGEEILAREQFFHTRRAGGPGKTVPADAYVRAIDQAARVPKSRLRTVSGTSSGADWVSVNPAGMFYEVTGANYISGRTNAIAFNPGNPATIYIGAAGGGIWKTVDGGAHWVPLTDNLSTLTCGAVAVDPNDTNVVYFGTGELNYSLDSYYGNGLFRTSNGGQNWARIASTLVGRYISQVVIDPSNSSSIFVAGSAGIWHSTDAGSTWAYTQSGTSVNCLLMDPTNHQVLYASRGGASTNTVIKSTDGGGTWSTLSSGLPSGGGRTQLAMAPSSPSILYASISDLSYSGLLGLYRTSDGGATWSLQNSSTNYLGSQGWYDNAVTVHPANPNAVFVGGLDVYESTDSGRTLTQVSSWFTTIAAQMTHADIHYLGFNGGVLYCGSDGGVYRSANNGSSWTDLNRTLSTLQYQSADYDPSNTLDIYGGTQDNNIESTTDGGATWIQRSTGDGGYTVVDPTVRTTVYSQYVLGSLKRSTDSGVNFEGIGPAGSSGGLFCNPYEMAPGDHNVIVFGRSDVWVTTSASTATSTSGWSPINTGVGGNVSAIGISATDATRIYIGTDNGKIMFTANNGSTWATVSGFSYVSDIFVDHSADSVAYATFGGFNTMHVAKTTDAGTTWSDISSNLPNIPVNTIMVRPIEPRIIFVGTDLGVFSSSDEGATWTSFNNGLPAAEVFDLKYNDYDDLLLAATHGRGCFMCDLSNFKAFFTPRSIAFGNILVGGIRHDSVEVANTGFTPLVISSVSSDRAEYVAAPSSANIPVSGSTTFQITYTPTPTGLTRGSIVFASDASSSPDTIRVSGYGGVGTIVATTLVDADGDPSTTGDRAATTWHLSVYMDSVSPASLVAAGNTGQLSAFVPKTGTYIVCEADSGNPWLRLNGNRTLFDTLTMAFNTTLTDTMVNARYGIASSVEAGWNLVSIPVAAPNDALLALFPGAVSSAFSYTPGIGYNTFTQLANGVGYWLKFGSGRSGTLIGYPITTSSFNVFGGWNLIGSISRPIPVAAIADSPAGNVTSSYWGYAQTYVAADTIQPGKGYWVKAVQNGRLALTASSSMPSVSSAAEIGDFLGRLSSIQFTDARGEGQILYFGAAQGPVPHEGLLALPPPPPSGLFSARFASDRIAEWTPAADPQRHDYRFALTSATYPVSVHWKLAPGSSGIYTLKDPANGQRFAVTLSDAEGTELVEDEKVTALLLTAVPASLPARFALQQNFPNPFNPSTAIRYQLPVESKVSLKVYDILGREVASLVDEVQSPGYKSVEWNSTAVGQEPAASGIYYYRLRATPPGTPGNSFVRVMKMLLVK